MNSRPVQGWPAPPPGHAGLLATVDVDDQPTRVFVQRVPDGGTLVIGQSLALEEAAGWGCRWPSPLRRPA